MYKCDSCSDPSALMIKKLPLDVYYMYLLDVRNLRKTDINRNGSAGSRKSLKILTKFKKKEEHI